MNKIIYVLLCLTLSNMTTAQETDLFVKNQLIIKLKPNVKNILQQDVDGKLYFENDMLNALNKRYKIKGIELTGYKKERETLLLKFKSKQNIDELISAYQKTGLLAYAEPNFIGTGGGPSRVLQTIPNETLFSRQYGLHNDGSFTLSTATVDADIDMDLAWDLEQGDPSIIVAVLDAGLKLDHPEFAGRLWTNASENANGTDSDNNGFIDDIDGWDFANNDNDPTDDHGHGTNVTGIVGASGNNMIGYAGVDWNCKIMTCKILNQNNFGQYSWWTDAIYYAVDHGAKVINMSVGGSGFSNTMQAAVNYAYNNGVTIVACMMNFDNNVTQYPAGYQNTIAVGSTNANDERSSPFFWSATSGSNYGNHIDVSAPGNYIYGLSYQSNTNYNSYWGGTSQATPLVTGLASLLLAQDPTRTPDDIRAILRSTAEDQVGTPAEDTPGFDVYHGYGRINAYEALLQGILAINEPTLDEIDLYVFPNPSATNIHIQTKMTYRTVVISNMLGAQVYSKDITNHSDVLAIDISPFAKGTYMLTLLVVDEKVITSRQIIRK